MTEPASSLHAAIAEGDAKELRQQLLATEFVLLSTTRAEDNEDENVGALTAEIDDFEVLVAFTTEAFAKQFTQEMDELFEEEESVDGIVVDGGAMLEYLPEGYGLLVDPEMEECSVVNPQLTAELLSD